MKSHCNVALFNLLTRLSVEENVELSRYSTLKIGGPARYMVMPTTVAEISDIQRACFEHDIDLHMLSGGSNTLFSDAGFSGLVMKLGKAFDFVEPSTSGLTLKVGAAASFAKVTKMAIMRGWRHAAGFYGTPGLMGGAIRMNAGTRSGEIKDVVGTVFGVMDGKPVVFNQSDVTFDYRKTSFPDGFIISSAELNYDEKLIEPIDKLMMQVEQYRIKRKKSQPITNSLGSFFKNPYPFFAAQLIEKCNLKGLKYKGAQISPLHANFIINNGGASAHDILHIASIAQRSVFDEFGIMLSPEIRMVGTFREDDALHHNVPIDTSKSIQQYFL